MGTRAWRVRGGALVENAAKHVGQIGRSLANNAQTVRAGRVLMRAKTNLGERAADARTPPMRTHRIPGMQDATLNGTANGEIGPLAEWRQAQTC